MDDQTRALLDTLHRGGAYGFWWTSEGKASIWWHTDKMTSLPTGRRNIYVGVHPVAAIPETNARGEAAASSAVRSQVACISAINCLFAEYDAKDFGNDKPACRAAIAELDPPPSAIVDSGGGYHCYWLLDKPFPLSTPDARARAVKIQAAWVRLMGSDPASKDLARVLRVPGTKNYKYDPPRNVVLNELNERRYKWAELAKLAAPFVEGDRPIVASSDRPTDRYAASALAGEITNVVTALDGQKHKELFKSAARIGELVGAKVIDQQAAEDALYAAIESRAKDKRGALQTVKDGIAKGMENPRKLPEPKTTTQQATAAKEVEYVTGLTPLLGSDLMLKNIPPTRHFVQNIIRSGLAFFIGQPGVGKTPALIQLAIAFATGGLWLGAFRVSKIKVAYIGPEYDEGDVRNIIMESTGGRADLRNLLIFTVENFAGPRSEEEALQMIDDLVRIHQVEAIIIDLLPGFLPPEKFKQNAYRGDYKEFLAYHRTALGHQITIIGAWHGTKRDANPATMYNGGQGFWGSAGGGRMVMYQDETDQVKLYSQLRGNKALTYTLAEASVAGCRIWSILEGTGAEPAFGSDIHRAIYYTIKEHAPAHGLTPKTIAGLVRPELDKNVSEAYVRKCIGVLVKRGLLKAIGDAYVVRSEDRRDREDRRLQRTQQDRKVQTKIYRIFPILRSLRDPLVGIALLRHIKTVYRGPILPIPNFHRSPKNTY
jgi:AAA domain-containing protein